MSIFPICIKCKHLIAREKGPMVCQAFPKGIPDSILFSDLDHRMPVKGDHGIQFEPKPDEVNDGNPG